MSERTPEEMESNGMGGMGGSMGGDMPAPAPSSPMGMGMGSESPAPAAPVARPRRSGRRWSGTGVTWSRWPGCRR